VRKERIVGVVVDVRHASLETGARTEVYMPRSRSRRRWPASSRRGGRRTSIRSRRCGRN